MTRPDVVVTALEREAVMLVISDGVESCGQDPCAVAAALARAKPHLKINVVDITGTGAGNCVARATHGQVFTAKNADEVVAMFQPLLRDEPVPVNGVDTVTGHTGLVSSSIPPSLANLYRALTGRVLPCPACCHGDVCAD